MVEHGERPMVWITACAYNIAGHLDIQMAYGDMARHRDGTEGQALLL